MAKKTEPSTLSENLTIVKYLGNNEESYKAEIWPYDIFIKVIGRGPIVWMMPHNTDIASVTETFEGFLVVHGLDINKRILRYPTTIELLAARKAWKNFEHYYQDDIEYELPDAIRRGSG